MILSQFLITAIAAAPIGPVITARINGQLDLIHCHAACAAFLTALNAASTIRRNVSDFL